MDFSRLIPLVAVSWLVVLSGCDLLMFDEAEDDQLDVVDEHEQLWQDQGIADYRVTYGQQTGGGVKIDTFHVFVSEQTVDSVETSASRDELIVDTVDSFFEHIRGRIGDDNVLNLSINFQDNIGYPTTFEALLDEGADERIETFEIVEDESEGE